MTGVGRLTSPPPQPQGRGGGGSSKNKGGGHVNSPHTYTCFIYQFFAPIEGSYARSYSMLTRQGSSCVGVCVCVCVEFMAQPGGFFNILIIVQKYLCVGYY